MNNELLMHAYMRALRLLADVSMHIKTRRPEKFRRLIEREFRAAERLIDGFRWVRSVNHFVVWIEDDDQGV